MEEERATTDLRRSKTTSSRSTLASEARRRRRSSSPYRTNFTLGNGSSVSLLHAKSQENPEKISYMLSGMPQVYKEDTSTWKAVVSILSGLYGLLLVAAGTVLVTSTRAPPVVTQGFYLYLYCAGAAVTLFLLRRKQKPLTEDETLQSVTAFQVCFGTLFLRISTVGFGILGMLYIGLQLIQSVQCKENVVLVLLRAAWMVFTLLQTLLVFRSGTWEWVMSRVILAHLLACNVCTWFQSVLHYNRQQPPLATELVLMNTEQSNKTSESAAAEGNGRLVTNFSEFHDWNCDSSEMMDTVEQYAVPLLYPCSVEYSVLCIIIILSMWRNATTIQHSFPDHDGIENNPGLKIEEDWQCGLLCGLLVLVGTAISLVLYFVLYQEPGFEPLSSMLLDATLLTLLFLSTLAALLLCFARTRQRNGGTGTPNSPVDGAVLWMAQGGVYFSHMFSIVTQLLDAEVSPTRLAVSLVTVVQSSVLTPFLLSPRKAPNTARQLLGFTLAVLVSLTVVCHVEYVRVTEAEQEWLSLRPTFGPLCLLYHVQTTVAVWHLLGESCQSSQIYL